MARRPDPGICVHCLGEFEWLNWDHVFPESWYPETTPKNLHKWQIPSCYQCNKEYGEFERDLMIRLGLCLEPEDEESKGIAQKALRAIDPLKAKNNKDRKARLNKRKQLLNQVMVNDNIPEESIFPNFGRERYPDAEERIAVPFSQKKLFRMAEKIVRGILFIEESVLVGKDFEVSTFVLTDEGAAPFVEIAKKFGKQHSRGPGINVIQATVPEDNVSSVFVIEIWGRLKLYSVVQRADAQH
jgi:hypothetical protein